MVGADPSALHSLIVSHRPPPPPKSPLEILKEEAKRLYTKGKFGAAAEAYTQAIVSVVCCGLRACVPCHVFVCLCVRVCSVAACVSV